MLQDQLKRIPFLYKYMGKCLPHIGNILVNRQLYFSSPRHFNDPFDCALGLNLQGATDKDWVDYFTHLAEQESPDLPPDEWRKRAEYLVRIERHRDQKYVKKFEDETRKASKELGILCLSSNPYSVMMWAHYADNHEGLLLRFDTRHLRDQTSNEVRCFKTEHSVSFPRIPEYLEAVRASDSGDNDAARKLFFCRKSRDWKKEKEWRLFTRSPNSFLPFDPPLISGVIFGWKMPSSIRNLIKAWTSKYIPKPELLEAKPCRSRFRMSIAPIKGRKAMIYPS